MTLGKDCRHATFEEACRPIGTEEMLASFSMELIDDMTARARLDLMLIDPDTFEPFKIIDGYRWNLTFASAEK